MLAVQGVTGICKRSEPRRGPSVFDFAPPFADDTISHSTYYSTNYDHRILVPGPARRSDILQESQWALRLRSSRSAAEVKAVGESPTYLALDGGAVRICAQ